MDRMRTTLAIGDFSQATHLSIKTLRHYHRVGLLEPADVDPGTGHRRYTADQIADGPGDPPVQVAGHAAGGYTAGHRGARRGSPGTR